MEFSKQSTLNAMKIAVICLGLLVSSCAVKPKIPMASSMGTFNVLTEDTIILTTDGSSGRYSFGKVELQSVESLPVGVSATIERLTKDKQRPAEINIFGKVVGIAGDQFYIYESESNWTDWQDIPRGAVGKSNAVSAYLTDTHLNIFMNGIFIGKLEINDASRSARKIAIQAKGDSKFRGSVKFSNIRLTQGTEALDEFRKIVSQSNQRIKSYEAAREREDAAALASIKMMGNLFGGLGKMFSGTNTDSGSSYESSTSSLGSSSSSTTNDGGGKVFTCSVSCAAFGGKTGVTVTLKAKDKYVASEIANNSRHDVCKNKNLGTSSRSVSYADCKE